MKKRLLSFVHRTPSPQSQVWLASGTLLQSIDLALAAKGGRRGRGLFRMHHFPRQLTSPNGTNC